jgi:hypothetical protein
MTVRQEHEPTVYQESAGPSTAALGVVAIVVVLILALLLFRGTPSAAPTEDGQENAPVPSAEFAPPSL